MTPNLTFLDCRGLTAPLAVLRIKQAMIGRADIGLPLDVLIDSACCDGDRVARSLTGEPGDIRLFHTSETSAAFAAGAIASVGEQPAHA